ncbi:hypothetical protein SD80_030880 [Scytonema tolypothrichoides VB-61278]|nr:hypothetical protein SD80_030880 [Scytonema tolypothrichoides VB-61278]
MRQIHTPKPNFRLGFLRFDSAAVPGIACPQDIDEPLSPGRVSRLEATGVAKNAKEEKKENR